MAFKIERFIFPFAVLIVLALSSANVASAQSYQTYGTYYAVPVQQYNSSQVWYSYPVVYPSQYIAPTYRVAQGTVISTGYPVYGTPVVSQNSGYVIQGSRQTSSQPVRQPSYQPVIPQSYPGYSGYSAPICIGGS